MAFDKSEPRVGLIFQIGIFSVLILLGIRAALTSYFDSMWTSEQHRKIGMATPTALINLRADEDKRLKDGPMPIDKAMEAMVVKGRMNASPDISPSASRDVAPLQGWQKLPAEVPAPMMAPPPPVDQPSVSPEPAGSAAPDGGAPTKGGVKPLNPKKPAPKKP
jgi:hypothetical protein